MRRSGISIIVVTMVVLTVTLVLAGASTGLFGGIVQQAGQTGETGVNQSQNLSEDAQQDQDSEYDVIDTGDDGTDRPNYSLDLTVDYSSVVRDTDVEIPETCSEPHSCRFLSTSAHGCAVTASVEPAISQDLCNDAQGQDFNSQYYCCIQPQDDEGSPGDGGGDEEVSACGAACIGSCVPEEDVFNMPNLAGSYQSPECGSGRICAVTESDSCGTHENAFCADLAQRTDYEELVGPVGECDSCAIQNVCDSQCRIEGGACTLSGEIPPGDNCQVNSEYSDSCPGNRLCMMCDTGDGGDDGGGEQDTPPCVQAVEQEDRAELYSFSINDGDTPDFQYQFRVSEDIYEGWNLGQSTVVMLSPGCDVYFYSTDTMQEAGNPSDGLPVVTGSTAAVGDYQIGDTPFKYFENDARFLDEFKWQMAFDQGVVVAFHQEQYYQNPPPLEELVYAGYVPPEEIDYQ